LYSKL